MIRFTFLLLFSSCAFFSIIEVEPIKHNNVVIEKEVMPHVKVFEDLCERKVKSNIRFGYLPGTIVGLCQWYPFGTNEITIDISYWRFADECSS